MSAVAETITFIWNEVLQVQRAELDRSFTDYGGTSLSANQLVAQIQKELGITVPVIRVFEFPTLRQFLDFVARSENLKIQSSVTPVSVSIPQPASSAQHASTSNDIAIIGMACRFPDADSVDEFWENLVANKESIKRIPADQLSPEVPEEIKRDPRYVPACGMINDPYKMDAAFFDINPKEAKLIDPQQRVILETAWAALENAGYAPGTYQGKAGVFAGVEDNSYYRAEIAPFPEAETRAGRFVVMTGNEKDYVAMRIAHKLDLRGPAISVHTACSTSLVAVIMACKSLRNRECDMALAGGASVHFPTPEGYYYQEGGVFSSDGHCKPFDKDAQGTVFTDGSGIVVLKRLDDALRDKDSIVAVIKGGAINSDGGNRASFSAPSISGQADCISDALKDANVDPGTLQYVEAHGTATPVGDPIEVEGLRQAFGPGVTKKQFCGLGSVKSNIGHTTAAAGVASLIKTALALQREIIPATLHFQSPNVGLRLEDSPFYVTAKNTPWPKSGGVKRRAGLSSFGIGGTNSHLVLEEAPEDSHSDDSESITSPSNIPFEIFPISAKTETARDRLLDVVCESRESWRNIAFTLQSGRADLRMRGARVRFNDVTLPDIVVKQAQKSIVDPRLVFMFPGQGAQYLQMGKGLYRQFPVFKETFDSCAKLMSKELDLDFLSFTFDDTSLEALENTRYTQPALFAIEVALGRLLISWGIKPEFMIGHSVGEFAAAHLAGVFSLEDGIKLIAARGRLMAALPRGRMLSARAPLEVVQSCLVEGVDIASVNSPIHCVLSGENEKISLVQQRLEAKEIPCRPLHTSHAFHSSMMDPVVEPFLEIAKQVTFAPPQFDIISTVTGEKMTAEMAMDPGYWANHLRATVQFSKAFAEIVKIGGNLFVEVGPRTTLATLAVQQLKGLDAVALSTLGDSSEGSSEVTSIATALAKLWGSGFRLKWEALWTGGRKVALPSYPFERKEFRFSEGLTKREPPRVSAPPVKASLDVPATVVAPQAGDSVRDQLIRELSQLCSDHTGLVVDQPRISFIELGLDSLILMQFGVEIGKRYGVSVSLRDLMGAANTIELVAQHIEKCAEPARLRRLSPVVSVPVQTLNIQSVVAQIDGASQGDVLSVIQNQLKQMKEVLELQIRYIDTVAQNREVSTPVTKEAKIEPSRSEPTTKSPTTEQQRTALSVPSSAAQREIFSASLFDAEASLAFNHPISVFFDGALDRIRLQAALTKLMSRHQALRGHFSADGMTFIVREESEFKLPEINLSTLSDDARKAAYESFIKEEVQRPFDLTTGPLFRATLVVESDSKFVLCFTCHHTIVDGWSLKIILADLPKLYSGDISIEPAASFADYLVQAVKNEEQQGPDSLDYFKDVFEDGTPVLDLPLDYPRPIHRTYRSQREDFKVNRVVYDKLKKVGAEIGASQFVTLLAAFSLYLLRISSQTELVIGVPVAGQIRNGKAKLLGHDSRVIPLLCQIREGDTFRTYVDRLKEQFLSAYEHQWVSMPELLRALNIQVDASRVPFVSTLFNFDPGVKAEEFKFAGLDSRFVFNARAAEIFEVSINCVVEGNDLVLEFAYNAALFNETQMHKRLEQLELLMASISDSLDLPVHNLEILPENQRVVADSALNNTVMPFERDLCVDQLIERIVRSDSNRVAVEFGAVQLSYGEIWEQSTKVAQAILEKSTQGDQSTRLVGVLLERSENLVGTLLGVWRAGAAYVPLDPAYPLDRIEYMVEHSGVNVIITQSELAAKVAGGEKVILDISEILSRNITSDQISLPFLRNSEDLAYVIYTSGSTGKPKGVKVPHRALNNFLVTMATQQPGISREDRVLAITTLSFDIAELELWLPLTVGARTVVIDRATAIDAQALRQVIEGRDISIMQATPATWRLLMFSDWQGKRDLVALCGGEALPRELAEALVPRVKKLWNVYGPTETTVWSTIDEVKSGAITIGRPIGNTQLYILDAGRKPVPQGCVGELWIGGDGVTSGYLHAPELTAERFIPNPFTKTGLMYKTGDVVRQRLDGRVEYVGRNDFQVKVRGFRIELGEVQHVLSRQPHIGQCVVVVRDRVPGDAHLVAYFTKREKSGPALMAESLKAGMRKDLPEYMIPTYFMELSALPLTQNGKVDQKQLPNAFALPPRAEEAASASSSELEEVIRTHPFVKEAKLVKKTGSARPVLYYIPRSLTDDLDIVALRKFLRGKYEEATLPQKVVTTKELPREDSLEAPRAAMSDQERYLAGVWKEYLGVPAVKSSDNFFNLGGHSLLTIQMIERVYKDVGVRFTPKMILLNNLDFLAKQLTSTIASSDASLYSDAQSSPRGM